MDRFESAAPRSARACGTRRELRRRPRGAAAALLAGLALLWCGAPDAGAQTQTFVITDGPGQGQQIEVDGTLVVGPGLGTFGNLGAPEAGCPDPPSSASHFHGFLNGVGDPNGTGCGWGHVQLFVVPPPGPPAETPAPSPAPAFDLFDLTRRFGTGDPGEGFGLDDGRTVVAPNAEGPARRRGWLHRPDPGRAGKAPNGQPAGSAPANIFSDEFLEGAPLRVLELAFPAASAPGSAQPGSPLFFPLYLPPSGDTPSPDGPGSQNFLEDFFGAGVLNPGAPDAPRGPDPAPPPPAPLGGTTVSPGVVGLLAGPGTTSGEDRGVESERQNAAGYRRLGERTRRTAEGYRDLAEGAREHAETLSEPLRQDRLEDAERYEEEAERLEGQADEADQSARDADARAEERAAEIERAAAEATAAEERARQEYADQLQRERDERIAAEEAAEAERRLDARLAEEQRQAEARRAAAQAEAERLDREMRERLAEGGPEGADPDRPNADDKAAGEIGDVLFEKLAQGAGIVLEYIGAGFSKLGDALGVGAKGINDLVDIKEFGDEAQKLADERHTDIKRVQARIDAFDREMRGRGPGPRRTLRAGDLYFKELKESAARLIDKAPLSTP